MFYFKKINQIKNLFFLSFLVFNSTFILSQSLQVTDIGKSQIRNLINDFKHYITSNIYFHAGDLYQHSIWTANAVQKFWNNQEFWVNGIDENDKNLTIFAALIHDIGKAGDLNLDLTGTGLEKIQTASTTLYSFFDKKFHPKKSFEYLTGQEPYRFAPEGTTTLNYRKLFKDLKISDNDKKLLAITVGMHWDFGGMVLRKTVNKEGEQVELGRFERYKNYLTKLKCLVQELNYNNGQIDERLIRICVLISAADTMGVVPVRIDNNIFGFETPRVPEDNPAISSEKRHSKAGISRCTAPTEDEICKQKIAYYKYNYQEARSYRGGLLKYFNDNRAKFVPNKKNQECERIFKLYNQ